MPLVGAPEAATGTAATGSTTGAEYDESVAVALAPDLIFKKADPVGVVLGLYLYPAPFPTFPLATGAAAPLATKPFATKPLAAGAGVLAGVLLLGFHFPYEAFGGVAVIKSFRCTSRAVEIGVPLTIGDIG